MPCHTSPPHLNPGPRARTPPPTHTRTRSHSCTPCHAMPCQASLPPSPGRGTAPGSLPARGWARPCAGHRTGSTLRVGQIQRYHYETSFSSTGIVLAVPCEWAQRYQPAYPEQNQHILSLPASYQARSVFAGFFRFQVRAREEQARRLTNGQAELLSGPPTLANLLPQLPGLAHQQLWMHERGEHRRTAHTAHPLLCQPHPPLPVFSPSCLAWFMSSTRGDLYTRSPYDWL